MSITDKIGHYQRNLLRCRDDEARMLYCIKKLYNLPVTVRHLQKTGVGRTVNSFRKYDGIVGNAAKALVCKWKIMVVHEDSTDDEDESYQLDIYENNTESPEVKIEDVKEYISSLEPSVELKHENKYKEIKSESIAEQNIIHPSKSRLEEKHEKKHSSKHSQSERRSSEKSSKKKEEGHSSTKHNSSRNNDMKRNSEKTVEINENSSRKRKADNSSFSKESKKRKGSESKSDDEKSQVSVSEKNHSRSKSSGFQIEVKIKVKDEPDKSKQDAKQDKYLQEKSKSSSSKSKSLESSGKEKDSGERQNHKKEEYVSRDKKEEARKDSSHHSSKEASKSKVSSSSDKDHLKNKNKDKKKEQKEEKSKQEKKKETKVKLMQEINGDEGIDCNSGTSFAEALGMCTIPQPSKKRHINSNTSLNKSIKMESMSPPINSKKTPTVKETVKETESSNISNPPSLLAPNVKLEPLNVDLASTLPEISPNYKPLPYINPVHRREEVKLIDDIIYVKNQRTKVYSGNKGGYTSVPTLYDICIRVLIENIDALEYTGGVPYDILKPVLERATPDQLYMLEHYNSYLVEDTDTLWKYHCNREFRNKERQEMESWREMYMRCLDEREAKLKTLTENIKQSIDKSVPVRSTKLAYVDNVVKPPRNIMKKQAKYGTANATPSTISSVKKKLTAGGAVNNATNIAVPPPPMARFKASTSNSMKKTKAPLMAKALQLIKGRYKR